jgi:protein kinase C substrate 80K-H
MLFALLALPGFAADIPKPSGVSPALLAQYAPIKSGSSLTWKCLDGSKIIDWSDINNDYCDCPDGSDEPGVIIRNMCIFCG